MSMSTHVVGFRPPDEKWKKMKAAYEGCQAAGVEPPEEVSEFFGWEPPGDKPGMEIDVEKLPAIKEWQDQERQGFEVDLTALPKDLVVIRFYNAW